MRKAFCRSFLISFVTIAVASCGHQSMAAGCGSESASVSLFRELEAAGAYSSFRLDDRGNVQLTEHSLGKVTRQKAGSIDAGSAKQFIADVDSLGITKARSFYGPVDPRRLYESGFDVLTVIKHGKRSEVVFHESNYSASPFKELSAQVARITSTLPQIAPGSAQLVAAKMLSRGLFGESLSNWQSAITEPKPDAPALSLSPNDARQPPELNEAVTRPGLFVAVRPERHGALRQLYKGARAVYVQCGGDTYIVRLFE